MKFKDKNNLFYHLDYECWDVEKDSTALNKTDISVIISEGGRLCKNGKIVDKHGIFVGNWCQSDSQKLIKSSAKIADQSKVYESVIDKYLFAHAAYMKNVNDEKNVVDELHQYATLCLGRKIERSDRISFVQKVDERLRGVIVVMISFIDSCLHHGVSISYSTEEQIAGSIKITENMSKKEIDVVVSNMKKIVFVDKNKIDLFDIFDAKGKTNIISKKIVQSYRKLADLVNGLAIKEANRLFLTKNKMVGDICRIDFSNKVSVFCGLVAHGVYDVSYELASKNSTPSIINKLDVACL
jgi:hypothetical protein